jgi:YHS domain-containing protein
MTEHARDLPDEAPYKATCRVCLKPLGPDEKKWRVPYRGTEHLVCCPSCVQAFNGAPRQYVGQP